MRQPAAAPLDHFCILFLREKDVPARHERRTSYRWGISRCGFNRSMVACDANSVANEIRSAVCRPRGPRVTRQCYKQNRRRVVPPREGPTYRWRMSRMGAVSDLFA